MKTNVRYSIVKERFKLSLTPAIIDIVKTSFSTAILTIHETNFKIIKYKRRTFLFNIF